MKTIRMSKQQMEKRIARFCALKPLPIQHEAIPEKARDVVYARKLLSVIGLEQAAQTPINAEAPIRGGAFRNVGAEEGILQVIITGGVHDMTDIAFSGSSKQEIEAVSAGLAAEFEKAGFKFDAAE